MNAVDTTPYTLAPFAFYGRVGILRLASFTPNIATQNNNKTHRYTKNTKCANGSIGATT